MRTEVSALRFDQNCLTFFHCRLVVTITWFSTTRRKARVSSGAPMPTGQIPQSLPKMWICPIVLRTGNGSCIYRETPFSGLQLREDRPRSWLIRLVEWERSHRTEIGSPTSIQKGNQFHSGKSRSHPPREERP